MRYFHFFCTLLRKKLYIYAVNVDFLSAFIFIKLLLGVKNLILSVDIFVSFIGEVYYGRKKRLWNEDG